MSSTDSSSDQMRPAQRIEALLDLLSRPHADDFFNTYATHVHQLCQAEAALVIRRDEVQQAYAVGMAGNPALCGLFLQEATASIWDISTEQGYRHDNLQLNDGSGVIRLVIQLISDTPTLLLLAFAERHKSHLKEALVRALLVKDIRPPAPASAVAAVGSVGDTSLQLTTPAQPGASVSADLLSLLGLASEVMQAPRFGVAALSLVNGLVRRLGLQQAVLCWRQGRHAELVAVSHIERFESTSPLVHAFQAAAEEVLSIDQVVQIHPETETDAHPPAHAALQESLQTDAGLISLPIRDRDGQTQAVVICLLNAQSLSPEQINQLLLMLELVLPKLQEGRRQEANWFKRTRIGMLPHLEALVGPGRPWVKFWSLLATLVMLILVFGRYPYSVEAPAQLTTDSTRLLTSQIDGRLLDVQVDMGDMVQENQVLTRLDTVELRQQELETRSEIQRYQAEEDKARAAGQLGDLQVAFFRREQAHARLKRVHYLLEQAEVKSPFDGVIVEGERRNLLGSSVRRGDKLFRVAKVENLYVILQIPERDIRDVYDKSSGRLVLLSQPGKQIHFRISNFVPMAQVKGEEGNHFLVKGIIEDPEQDWWRPGMTGLAKVDVGPRNIAWILLHRVVDTLRLKFWL